MRTVINLPDDLDPVLEDEARAFLLRIWRIIQRDPEAAFPSDPDDLGMIAGFAAMPILSVVGQDCGPNSGAVLQITASNILAFVGSLFDENGDDVVAHVALNARRELAERVALSESDGATGPGTLN